MYDAIRVVMLTLMNDNSDSWAFTMIILGEGQNATVERVNIIFINIYNNVFKFMGNTYNLSRQHIFAAFLNVYQAPIQYV